MQACTSSITMNIRLVLGSDRERVTLECVYTTDKKYGMRTRCDKNREVERRNVRGEKND